MFGPGMKVPPPHTPEQVVAKLRAEVMAAVQGKDVVNTDVSSIVGKIIHRYVAEGLLVVDAEMEAERLSHGFSITGTTKV